MNSSSVIREFVTSAEFIICLALLSCSLGVLTFQGASWGGNIFFIISYLVILVVFFKVIHVWDDWLNPLALLIFFSFIRFCLPGILLLSGASPEIGIFSRMGLENEDFLYGHVLALLGVLGVIIGWYFPKEMPSLILRTILGRLKIVSCNGVIYSTMPFLLLGLFGLIMFVSDNANIAEIVISGRFRSMEIQEGTGKYRYLSYMLISGGVILTAYLVHRKLPWYVALIPVSVVALLFAPLGGRSRALIPFIAGLLILWYRRDQRKVDIRLVSVGTIIMALLLVYLSAGARYRGRDGGLESISGVLSTSSLSKYARSSIWVDVGHLHSLAAATVIGPGVLGGKTFTVLLWPITEVLHLPGKSSGRFIFQELVSQDRKVGFNPSLIGDAYLNFGLTGVFVVTIVIGLMLKILYIEFRRGSIVKALYVILLVYSMWIFFVSILKYKEALVVLCFALLIIQCEQTIIRLISE